MLVDLVRLTTRDGFRLDGALRLPMAAANNTTAFDAVLFLHGVQSNFYTSSLFEGIAQPLLDRGLHLLSINTRGHDNVYAASTAMGGQKWQGAAYEIVDDCRHDVAAWCDWLVRRGLSRILLLGHSLGAVKSVYSQALEPHAAVRAVVAVSPPRFSHQAFVADPGNATYLDSLATAERLVAEGRGTKLFLSKFPFLLLITAASFLDKYGPSERYNIVAHLPQLTRPSLFVYGAKELLQGGMAFANVTTAIEAARQPAQACEVQVIENADHFYTGATGPLAEVVGQWIDRQPTA